MSFKASKLCLQGGGSDEAFAHAIDTDNAAAPAPKGLKLFIERTIKGTGLACPAPYSQAS